MVVSIHLTCLPGAVSISLMNNSYFVSLPVAHSFLSQESIEEVTACISAFDFEVEVEPKAALLKKSFKPVYSSVYLFLVSSRIRETRNEKFIFREISRLVFSKISRCIKVVN